jgi:ABC-2 type transport system permease protein
MADKDTKGAKPRITIKDVLKSIGSIIARELDTRGGNFILAIIVVVLMNIVGTLFPFRFDLTSNNMYSLSPVSRDVIHSIREPLIIKVFFSNELPPEYSAAQRYLLDLLDEYRFAANSEFRVDSVDVEEERGKQLAASFGLNPVQVQELGSDQFKQRNAYMGLVIIHGDLVEKITEITSPDGLEYRITTAIRKMAGKNDSLLSIGDTSKDPIKVTLYVSGELANFNIEGYDKLVDTVKTVFDRVNAINYKKLAYNAIDPSANKSTGEIIKRYGIHPLRWKETVLRDGKRIPAGEGVLAVVIEHGDRFQTIQLRVQSTIFGRTVIAGLEKLEDSINSAVSGVLSHNPLVAYASGNGERSLVDEREGAANLRTLMMEGYEVKEVDLKKEEIPDNAKVLIVNGPRTAYTDDELFRIDQFMMRGGNVLFLVDSFAEVRLQSRNPMQQQAYVPVESGLDRIFSSLGVKIEKNYVLDKKCYVQRGNQTGDISRYEVPIIEKSSLADDNVITHFMKKLIFIKASSVTMRNDVLKKNKLKVIPLVASSDEAWTMQGQINLNPLMIQPPDEKNLSKYNLAVLIEGKFRSAFDGVRPQSVATGPVTESGIREASHGGSAVVIGSSEIAGSQVVDTEGRLPNGAFMLNIIDYLSGRTDTPEMRSKGLSFNPLNATGEWTRFLIKGINIGIVPLLSIFAGLLVWHRRNVRRKKIQEQFAQREGSHE